MALACQRLDIPFFPDYSEIHACGIKKFFLFTSAGDCVFYVYSFSGVSFTVMV